MQSGLTTRWQIINLHQVCAASVGDINDIRYIDIVLWAVKVSLSDQSEKMSCLDIIALISIELQFWLRFVAASCVIVSTVKVYSVVSNLRCSTVLLTSTGIVSAFASSKKCQK